MTETIITKMKGGKAFSGGNGLT